MNLLSKRVSFSLGWLAVAVVMTSSGCSDDGAANEILTRKACLAEIASRYRSFHQQHGTSPPSQEAFVEFLSKEAARDEAETNRSGETLLRLLAGDFIVLYGGNLSDDPSADAKYILSFEAGVPGSGGYVAYGDGNVQHVTAKVYAETATIPMP
ncbi:hypothetical protein [Novipirellula artificiosorum]|uniref:Uncharacterized protein n=1 Tax=Novipirellula artificiosorum TaxID=2528016 RepID=A0A5C6E279_9BACT|nr:hypothetical protein [Novipirellula artificiosorum]TWU42825.1 hypothetical protein Poly41_11260 [Novipirellula artificiosorum]